MTRATIDDITTREIDHVLKMCSLCKLTECKYKSRAEVIKAAMMVFSGMPCDFYPKRKGEE